MWWIGVTRVYTHTVPRRGGRREKQTRRRPGLVQKPTGSLFELCMMPVAVRRSTAGGTSWVTTIHTTIQTNWRTGALKPSPLGSLQTVVPFTDSRQARRGFFPRASNQDGDSSIVYFQRLCPHGTATMMLHIHCGKAAITLSVILKESATCLFPLARTTTYGSESPNLSAFASPRASITRISSLRYWQLCAALVGSAR